MAQSNLAHPVRIALMGVGRIGVGHAAILAAIPEVELTVCDVVPDRAATVANDLNAELSNGSSPVSYSTPDEVFADTAKVDGIVIATPTATHEELILRCAEAGVPFFCEKPVATDLEGTLR
ncbi:MAG: hypothetical protein CSA82_01665, partial [Actinobacteria bacterium]